MYTIVKALMRLLSLLPLRLHYGLARVLSWLAEKVLRYRIDDVTINLARSFPDKKYGEIKEIRHRFYRHFGDLLAETVWFGGLRGGEKLHRQRLVEISNPETLNALYEAAPSVMVLMSHAGNWELIGGIDSYNYSGVEPCFNEGNFCVVYLRQKSPMWDAIMRGNRTAPLKDPKNYPGYIEARKAVRYVYEHKDEKKIYNFITDQHPYFKAPGFLKVNFMHQECSSMTGGADLARKFGMAVCFLGMKEESRGHYLLEYRPICTDASFMSSEEIMKEYYRLLETDLESQPWNWLWTHRRWKF